MFPIFNGRGRYSCLNFEVGTYRSDACASLKQMTGTQNSE